MGQCYGKCDDAKQPLTKQPEPKSKVRTYVNGGVSPFHPKFSSGANSPVPASPLPNFPASPAPSTPRRLFRKPFPPPSPAKHIQSSLAKRQGTSKPKEGVVQETTESEKPLDKVFGYAKNFSAKYELGHEVGRGHFGHTCLAKVRKGELKGQPVAVKIISKAKVIDWSSSSSPLILYVRSDAAGFLETAAITPPCALTQCSMVLVGYASAS